MKLDVFQALLKHLKNNSDRLDAAYALEIDLMNFTDGYDKIITILLSCYYGEEGYDWIAWFLYERDPEKGITAYDEDQKEICTTEEELWVLVEKCRSENKTEYSLPVPLTDEQREQMLKSLFS